MPNYDMAADRDRAEDRAEQAARARAAERNPHDDYLQFGIGAYKCCACNEWFFSYEATVEHSERMARRSISASTAPSAQRSSNDEVDGCK